MVFRCLEQLIFRPVTQEATFHQNSRTPNVIHEIDGLRYGCRNAVIPGIKADAQNFLRVLCERLTSLGWRVKYVGTAVSRVLKGILMDTDQKDRIIFEGIDSICTVMKVGNLFFPQGRSVGIVKRNILHAKHDGGNAVKPHDLIQPPRDGQIYRTLFETGKRNCAPVFPAVSRVNDQL